MKMTVYILTFLNFTLGCGQVNQENSTNPDTILSKNGSLTAKVDASKINKGNTQSDNSKKWPDSLINSYIHHTDNKLIRLALKDKISEEWLFDQIIKTDTAKYFIFQIGHDVSDSGETNMRFITDSWVYIDSLTNTLYEYDLPNNLLIKWDK